MTSSVWAQIVARTRVFALTAREHVMPPIAGNAARESARRRLVGLLLWLSISALLISVFLLEQSDASSKKEDGSLKKHRARATTTTTSAKPTTQRDDSEQEDEDEEQEDDEQTTTTTTTVAPRRGHRKHRRKGHKSTTTTTTTTEQPDEQSEQSPEEGSRSGMWNFLGGGIGNMANGLLPPGGGAAAPGLDPGGKLDEGQASIPGGGFPSCGKAPLNSLTPGGGPSGYIINGERQKYGEFPQYIHLETRLPDNRVGLCGGALISDRQVLTAAHCVKSEDTLMQASVFTVIFGEDNLRMVDAHELRVGVAHICVSAKYTSKSLRFDWAILTLVHPVQFSDHIQPACLPRPEQLIHTHGPQSKCFLVGAGAIGMNPSRANPQVAVPVSSQVINKLHTENVPCMIWGFGAIDRDRVCYTRANKMVGDSCVGDSGGPILCLDQQRRWTVMASVSYGSTFCEHARVAVYARTRTLLAEMQQQCGIKLL